VALSGAGPAVLVVVGREEDLPEATGAIRRRATEGKQETELLVCRFLPVGALETLETPVR
jgi:hypothetical protein